MLRESQEKFEASNEELQATNEELMSSNEELQSTNEELQSVNEELYTVNAELNAKIEELTNLNNDVNNLLVSTNIGTIFLDNELRIRKFTPAVRNQFNIANVDLGRPIFHFSNYFGFENFKDDIHNVMQKLEPLELKIKNNSNREYLMRINPFITSDQEVKGVVISFIDFSKITLVEEKLKKSEEFTRIYKHAPTMLYVVNKEGVILEVSDFWLRKMGYKRHEVIGKKTSDFLESNSKKIVEKDQFVSEFKNSAITDFYLKFVKKNGAIMDVLLSSFSDRSVDMGEINSIAVLVDVSEEKKAVNNLNESKYFIEEMAKAIPSIIYVYDSINDKNLFVNGQIQSVLGYSIKELQELNNILSKLFHPADVKLREGHIKEISNSADDQVFERFYRMKHKEGQYQWIMISEKVFKRDEKGNVVQLIGVAQSLNTAQKILSKINVLEDSIN